MVTANQMPEFVAWAKRRGVIFPSSEIYGGLSNSYDYGPVGVEMKNRQSKAVIHRPLRLERLTNFMLTRSKPHLLSQAIMPELDRKV